ncbi:tobamovirus multiplication protein 2A [Dorcoceras hygrometricum]|uniref:Tobamovirus multiplication protein 2A n=1 Tax=Dorcoceras hygrometricum TaxID=472368 RepID=A0A2Z7C8T3_9LAMI|nr:tobamovirus multiplication protein 2A [Dorcoceras hygrometricum]
MDCKSFWACLLKVLNSLFVLVGLAMIGYGVYLFVEYKTDASTGSEAPSTSPSMEFVQLGRPLLLAVPLADSIFDNLPKAWFIYLFIGIGVILVIVACGGCIGTCARSRCCLTCYSVLVIILILVELGVAAFIFFDKTWQEDIPADRTGNFDMIYRFLERHWKVIRWVALGIVIFEAVIFVLALVVRAANRPSDYDSDEEYIGRLRQQIQQPFINKQSGPATGAPATGSVDQRPSRNDAWSTRMREKYGLDTSEFTYNPSDSNRNEQASTQPSEERRRCIIM